MTFPDPRCKMHMRVIRPAAEQENWAPSDRALISQHRSTMQTRLQRNRSIMFHLSFKNTLKQSAFSHLPLQPSCLRHSSTRAQESSGAFPVPPTPAPTAASRRPQARQGAKRKAVEATTEELSRGTSSLEMFQAL